MDSSGGGELVWIPAVPLPLMGLFTDRCECGTKFRGSGRRHRYEIHYRSEHERLDSPVQVCVTRDEARAIYAEVDSGP